MSRTTDPFGLTSTEASSGDAIALEDLGEYLRGLKRRWKLITLVVVLCLAASVVHYTITPPRYRASTTLQIERRSTAALLGTQPPWLENWFNMEYYPTQYKLLESRGMAERVVKNLRLDEDPRFNRGTRGSARQAPSAELDRADLARIANKVKSGLSVRPLRGTQMVELIYVASTPELAAQLANGFAETYIEWGIETRSGLVGKASTYLGQEIEALKEDISSRETRLRELSRDESALNVNPEESVISQRLQTLNDQYMAALRQRIEKEARYQELLDEPRQTVAEAEASTTVSELMREQLRLEREYQTKLQIYKPDWPEMVELKSEIDEGREHLEEVIAREAQRAREAAFTELQTAKRQEAALAAEIDKLKREMLAQSSEAAQFSNLQVEVETRRELLDELLRRQSETEVAGRIHNSRESNVRVVDRALVPGNPFQPSLEKDLSMGLLAGLLLGFGGAFALEFMDRSIKTEEEVKRLLGLSVLATVPDMEEEESGSGYGGYGYGYGRRRSTAVRKKSAAAPRKWLDKKQAQDLPIELIPHHRPRLAVSEAYRALRTALLLSTAEDLGAVAVTSAGASEGKTVTVTNLAVVLAQLGRRVLVIDGDLRKPRIHSIFGVSNQIGLVHTLTGGAGPDEAILQTSVRNLFVIPAGPLPPNPSELLASSRMAELIAEARNHFDIVLIDTPPVLAVTDATVVGSLSDGVVLCLRVGQVLRADARTCRQRLDLADVKVLGAVLNGRRRQEGTKGGYAYYESYIATSDDSGADSAA